MDTSTVRCKGIPIAHLCATLTDCPLSYLGFQIVCVYLFICILDVSLKQWQFSEGKAELYALLSHVSKPRLKLQTFMLFCLGLICCFSLVSQVSLRPVSIHDCLSSSLVMHFYTFLNSFDRDHPRLQHLPTYDEWE